MAALYLQVAWDGFGGIAGVLVDASLTFSVPLAKLCTSANNLCFVLTWVLAGSTTYEYE